jgi:chromate transporter
MNELAQLAQLVLLFGKLSLLAVGGASATLPEIAREVIVVRHWMSPAEFAALYALSNAAPGPNVIIATVIGEVRAGVAGGIAATLAMVLPAATLAVLVSRGFEHHREARWRRVTQAALLPLTAGLVLAAAVVLVRAADTGWLTAALTALAAAVAYQTKAPPLLLFALGAAAGMLLL